MEGKLKFQMLNKSTDVGNVFRVTRAGMARFAENFSRRKRFLKKDGVCRQCWKSTAPLPTSGRAGYNAACNINVSMAPYQQNGALKPC